MCYIKDYEKKIVVTEIQKIIEYHNWSDNFVLFYDRINNKYDIFFERKKDKFAYCYYDIKFQSFCGFGGMFFDGTENYFLYEKDYINELIFNVNNYSDYYINKNEQLKALEFFSNSEFRFVNNENYLKAVKEFEDFSSEKYDEHNYFNLISLGEKGHPQYITYKLLNDYFARRNEEKLSIKFLIQSLLANPSNEGNILDVYFFLGKNLLKNDKKDEAIIFFKIIQDKIKNIYERSGFIFSEINNIQEDYFALDYYGNDNPQELLKLYNIVNNFTNKI